MEPIKKNYYKIMIDSDKAGDIPQCQTYSQVYNEFTSNSFRILNNKNFPDNSPNLNYFPLVNKARKTDLLHIINLTQYGLVISEKFKICI